jgi:hypothetical protein
MLLAQLQQAAEQRHAGDLRQTLDFGDVGSIQVAKKEVYSRNHGDRNGLGCHGASGGESVSRLDRETASRESSAVLYAPCSRDTAHFRVPIAAGRMNWQSASLRTDY